MEGRRKIVHLLGLMAGDDVAHQYLVVDELLAAELAALGGRSCQHGPGMAPPVPQ